VHRIPVANAEDWSNFSAAWRSRPTWLFGVLGYDLKNALETTAFSRHTSEEGEPDLEFFEPEWVLTCSEGRLVLYQHPAHVKPVELWWKEMQTLAASVPVIASQITRDWAAKWSAETYLDAARSMQQFMVEGDLYEANVCALWEAEGTVDPVLVFEALQKRADAPMAGLFKSPCTWLLSGSPERYMTVRQQGDTVRAFSQPIKGTAPANSPGEALLANEKERAENTMIVDLVRNDLSRVAVKGSVQVPRYLQLRSLPTVHHLVSTVEAELRPSADWLSVVQASFPMGSMTGAPKIRAMERIDQHESARRGWYSGALGYVTPDGECDFNVVIRSLLYHPKQERWKGWAGSALTVYAQPEAEWQELQLKMHAPMAAWKEAVAESTREGQPAKQDADVLMNGSNPEKA
jgi:para-aminobenzoate synthetase component 1